VERIKALFVDDQTTLRDQYAENIKIALSERGVELDVMTTEQVEDAKRMLRPGSHDFRLVVTDVLYGSIDGGGVSVLKPRGLEVVTQAAKTPGVAIVAISVGSNEFPRLEEMAKSAGAQVFRFRQDVQSSARAWDELAAEIGSALISVGAIAGTGGALMDDRQMAAKRDSHMPKLRTLSILFMDLSGWSKLKPKDIHAYISNALPKLAGIVAKHERLHQNTWGDALVVTFDSTARAAECALDLRDFFRRTPDIDGVPEGLIPRIALHVGEVIIATNPLRGAEDIFGDAVHRAARLEPATDVGTVFCTETFAKALAEVRGCAAQAHYVCEIELPKGFGRERAHVVLGPNETKSPAGVA
jgi:class 3 adenylate cyclase